ncbi:MAG: helix-turn-helix domain-containing protein [Erysipelotrichaceae bacterium]|nr:helix-turn-helix domain-containing protein [Erysipelotrichaceae bacterium]
MKYAVNKTLNKLDIKNFRRQLNLTQKELATLLNVSYKTVENWESGNKDISGPAVVLLSLYKNNPYLIKLLTVEENKLKERFYYMDGNYVSTIIDVDFAKREVEFKNYTNNIDARAFGNKEIVSFDEFEDFMESRCFPRSRDMQKIELERIGVPFYDPLLIIEKTKGRVEGDNYWIRKE